MPKLSIAQAIGLVGFSVATVIRRRKSTFWRAWLQKTADPAVRSAILATCLSSAMAAQPSDRWPDPIANHVVPYQTGGITVGPMVGCIEASSARIWLRTDEPVPFEVVYDTRLPLNEQSPAVAGRTQADADNTGCVDLTGLEANTRYFYGVRIGGYLVDIRMDFDDPWPSFRTLPDDRSYADAQNNPRGLFNFSFSIGCGMRQRTPEKKDNFGVYGNPPALLTLWNRHRDQLAFHIVNGDYTYEEVLDGTLAGYENNYRLYLTRGRNVSRFFRYVPALFTYDDHEINSNGDGSGEVGLGDGHYLRRDPALKVWGYYAEWANYASPWRGRLMFGKGQVQRDGDVLYDPQADFSQLDPRQVSTIHIGPYIRGDGRTRSERGGLNVGVYGLKQVIDRHRLRVTPAFRAAGTVPYSIGTHHFYEKKIANCHFFFLDARGERSKFIASRAHAPDRFILGPVQRQWLLRGVRQTDADIIFIISSVPWTIYHSAYHVHPERGVGSKGDGFCGYVHERELMLPELDALEKPVLIFTGDVHNSAAVQITDNVWEFMVGPVNSSGHPIGTAGLPPFGGWFDSEGRTVKVKWIGGYPDNVRYPRLRNTFYSVVSVNNVLPAAKPEGVGYQFVAYDEPQVVVQYYDGYTGRLLYAEGISTADAKKDQTPAPKKSRWPRSSGGAGDS